MIYSLKLIFVLRKQLDKVLQEKNLRRLEELLTEERSPYADSVDYLRSLKAVYSIMVAKTVAPDYKQVIKRFREQFDRMYYDLELLYMTPKVHMLYDHLEEWMDDNEGETLFFADTSGRKTKLSLNYK